MSSTSCYWQTLSHSIALPIALFDHCKFPSLVTLNGSKRFIGNLSTSYFVYNQENAVEIQY